MLMFQFEQNHYITVAQRIDIKVIYVSFLEYLKFQNGEFALEFQLQVKSPSLENCP